jgi:hypothetical protein
MTPLSTTSSALADNAIIERAQPARSTPLVPVWVWIAAIEIFIGAGTFYVAFKY